jgi:hypothetical protein
MKTVATMVVVGFATVGAGGCNHAMFYTGDGHLTDRGWLNYSGRYTIDLGPLDLAVPGSYSYKLSGLPHAELVVGVAVVEDKPNGIGDTKPTHPAQIRVELRNCENQVAILEEGALDTWVQSYALRDANSFYYRQGIGKEIPLPDGGTRGQRIGRKASGGWGTYFEAEGGCEYRLKLDVIAPEQSNRPARVVVNGYGRM